SVQPAPGTIIGGDRGAIPYALRHGGTFTACATTQHRAWFTDATVEGVDAGRLPAARGGSRSCATRRRVSGRSRRFGSPPQHAHDVRARAVHVVPSGDERPRVHARQ